VNPTKNKEVELQEYMNSISIPNISMVNIELYCDGNHPRGISILYNIDGQKSVQLNYIEKMSSEEVFRKH